jgi:hypothetical protein
VTSPGLRELPALDSPEDIRDSLRDQLRRSRVLIAALLLGILGTSVYSAITSRPSAEERSARAGAEAAIDRWGELLITELQGTRHSDAELRDAGVDPDGPGISDELADFRRMPRELVDPASATLTLWPHHVHVSSGGDVTAEVYAVFSGRLTDGSPTAYGEDRFLTLVPDRKAPGGLRLVRDQFDSRHGL